VRILRKRQPESGYIAVKIQSGCLLRLECAIERRIGKRQLLMIVRN